MPNIALTITRHSPEGSLWETLPTDSEALATRLEELASSLDEYDTLVGAVGHALLHGMVRHHFTDGSCLDYLRKEG